MLTGGHAGGGPDQNGLHLHSLFTDNFIGDASTHFLEYLESCAAWFSDMEYNGRIIALIGSSGMGKSKLGMDIACSLPVFSVMGLRLVSLTLMDRQVLFNTFLSVYLLVTLQRSSYCMIPKNSGGGKRKMQSPNQMYKFT
ncbi:hypothetical protein B0H10DRAFT_1946610 [Mycena sp. CBHHK59/15]|nr:hypothetical protein B0H10DRAFT_1946610 [Mycena sp. CBHHK59/15]